MEDKVKLVPCKKCKTKNSIKYITKFEKDDVLISIERCEKCRYKADLMDIFKYL